MSIKLSPRSKNVPHATGVQHAIITPLKVIIRFIECNLSRVLRKRSVYKSHGDIAKREKVAKVEPIFCQF